MTRVLVVHHDHDVADAEVEELRRAGYEVQQCAGPIGGDPCPLFSGDPCWQIEETDVLVYDVWAAGDNGRELIEDLRRQYPDKPVVLTSGGLLLDWAQTEGAESVTPVFGPPDRIPLGAAVEAALSSAPEARPDAMERGEPPPAVTVAAGRAGHARGTAIPRW